YTFSDYSKANKEKLITAINSILKENQLVNKLTQTFLQFSISAFELLFVVALSALFFKPEIPYRFRFKMSLYAATIYTVCTFFSVVTTIELFSLVGLILLMIYTYKALNFVIIKKVKDE